MNLRFFRSFLTCLVFTFPLLTTAQSRLPKGLQRFEIGYSFPMTTGKFTEHTLIYDDFSDSNIDTTFDKNYKTKGGFGVTIGTHFPIVKMSEKSSLNISLSYLYNLMVWDATLVTFDGYDYNTGSYTYNSNYAITAGTIHMGLPVGFDFKSGGEAALDRSNKLTLTLGTGIYPSINLTAFENYTGAKFKIQPYLKAELGMFAGVNWKVRALYAFGKLNYIDYTESFGSDTYAYENSATLTSQSSLTLSILVQPLSFAWEKSQWWR